MSLIYLFLFCDSHIFCYVGQQQLVDDLLIYIEALRDFSSTIFRDATPPVLYFVLMPKP